LVAKAGKVPFKSIKFVAIFALTDSFVCAMNVAGHYCRSKVENEAKNGG
jgi:hypothetical protein